MGERQEDQWVALSPLEAFRFWADLMEKHGVGGGLAVLDLRQLPEKELLTLGAATGIIDKLFDLVRADLTKEIRRHGFKMAGVPEVGKKATNG